LKLDIIILDTKKNWSLKINYLSFDYRNESVSKLVTNYNSFIYNSDYFSNQ